MKPRTLAILGAGYTGQFLLPLASRQYSRIFATSRDPDHRLTHIPPAQRLKFDLAETGTWANIPFEAELLWTFPAEPLESVKQWATALAASSRRLVVLGSTSAYDVAPSNVYPPPWIDETMPIDITKPRVEGEEYLRHEHRAIILRVSGIYGPGRNPLDWIRQGRVGPSKKYVNLIHVEDLAAICLAALERGSPGEVYNVSDGTPRRWDEIFSVGQERWNLTPTVSLPTEQSGKRLDTRKLQDTYGKIIRHMDLFSALEELER